VTSRPSLQRQVLETGFALVDELVAAEALPALRTEVDRLLLESTGRGGARNVLHKSPLLRELAMGGPPAEVAATILGPEARPTKLTVFDKTPEANWKVPWHQDLIIAVAARAELPGFGPWSVKDGIPHVQPPAEVLESILAIRLHLDDTPPSNGALRVLPGSHRRGRIPEADVASLRRQCSEVVVAVHAGGALLMRPLLLHASSAAELPSRRRVLHFEYSAARLPGGLAWA
jgi:hypothetical protein